MDYITIAAGCQSSLQNLLVDVYKRQLMAYINADNKTLPPAEEAPAAESETPDDPEAPSDTPTES